MDEKRDERSRPGEEKPSTPTLRAPWEDDDLPSRPAPDQEEPLENVGGIRMGNARVPRFLAVTYAALAVWAVVYALTATPINDRQETAQNPAGTYDGAQLFQQNCAGCHNVTPVNKVGPGLAGISKRMSDAELDQVLRNGRGQMPALPSLGLNEDQIKAIKEYLKTL